ncbi:glycosyltransferase [Mesonia sp. K7]|uniref:glycosyltransferase n=1 Tax=Mesonia sp. K7 TaxID=2218606 RepID=UPI000DA71609|nr:glycosyltransferase [Mesonia sp. K7]PZD76615.1 hypothetical protein DNG35_11535 [Mesonia sp. K7]
MNIKHIIYSADVDLSLPNGPGVNEREFVGSINRIFEDKITILIPKPKNAVVELTKHFNNKNKRVFYFSKRTINPILFLIKQIKIFFKLRELYQKEPKEEVFFVFRAILFPLGYFLFVKLYEPQYALRICGDGTFPFLNRNLFLKTIFKPINKNIMSLLYRNAVACDAVTKTHVFSLEENFKGNFYQIDNGVNTERFRPMDKNQSFLENLGFTQEDFIIGYTGNFPHIRGGDEIVEAFNFLKKNRKLKFKAIIAGDDGGVKILQDKINNYKLEKEVKLIGKVEFSKMPLIVSHLDLGVSFLDKIYRGASEQKVRQYLACGVPAVVSPGGSEFVEQNGIGKVVEHLEGIDKVANAFLDFSTKEKDEKKYMCKRARNYAIQNLSIDKQNLLRLSIWEKNLKKK